MTDNQRLFRGRERQFTTMATLRRYIVLGLKPRPTHLQTNPIA